MRLQDALRDPTISDVIESWRITPVKRNPMLNEHKLKPGQVIRYGQALYRVQYVNECRARIVPLAKRAGHEFDGEAGGVSISPNSCVEIIIDLDRAKTEMELEATETELRAAKAEMVSRGKRDVQQAVARAEVEQELADVEAELAEARRELGASPEASLPATVAARPARGGSVGAGWQVAAWNVPDYKPGSLAAKVLAYIVAHPGQNTKEIVAGVGCDGAIAACVSRFSQAGVIERQA